MGLWIVSDPHVAGSDLLAWEDTAEAQVYSYVPNLGDFRFNPDLTTDFRFDHDYRWEPVDAEGAAKLIGDEVGKIDRRVRPDVFDEFARAAAVPVEIAVQQASSLSPQKRARALAHKVREASNGQWVEWKSYPIKKQVAAYTASRDLRNGKIKALLDMRVEAEVQRTDDGYHVMVRRTAPAGD